MEEIWPYVAFYYTRKRKQVHVRAMSWRDELRAELLAAARNREAGAEFEWHIDETDAGREEAVARALAAAARVFKFATSTLCTVDVRVAYVADDQGHTLQVEDEFLEASLIMNGLVLKVRRETGVVDLLHVEDRIIIDGKRRPIGPVEAYFGRLSVELVRSACQGT